MHIINIKVSSVIVSMENCSAFIIKALISLTLEYDNKIVKLIRLQKFPVQFMNFRINLVSNGERKSVPLFCWCTKTVEMLKEIVFILLVAGCVVG